MKKWWVWLLIVIGVMFLFAIISFGWITSQYNSLVSMKEGIAGSWAQVENQLQRRSDLIPNLVNSTKGYMKHEKEIFIYLADARAKLAGANNISEKIDASKSMESALSRLLLIVENYPDLKANENFARLMDELSGTENRLAVERRRYNEGVKVYNTAVLKFPTNIIAGIFRFEKSIYFEVAEEAKAVPKVEF